MELLLSSFFVRRKRCYVRLIPHVANASWSTMPLPLTRFRNWRWKGSQRPLTEYLGPMALPQRGRKPLSNPGGSLTRERSRAAGLGAGRMVSPQYAQTAASACENSGRKHEAEGRAKHRWSSSSGVWKSEAKSEFRRRKRVG